MLAFGIGSLWFGLKADDFSAALEKCGASHLDTVIENLRKISNINNIILDKPDNLSFSFSEIDGEEGVYYPIYPHVEIRFDIYIPNRVQDEVLAFRESRTGSEIFDVIIKYGYDSVVVYIKYDAPDDYHQPSDAVVVVRKYLERELSKNSNDIVFHTLGPSPFHASFWLKKADKESSIDKEFIENNLTQKNDGYETVIFDYNPIIETDEEAFEKLCIDASGDIECFYSAVIIRNKLMSAVNDVDMSLDQLIDIYSTNGVLNRFRRFYKSEKVSKDLLVSLLEVEREKRRAHKMIGEYETSGRIKDYKIFSSKSIEKIKEFEDVLPINQIADVVKIFEERQLKSRENITVILAGLIGGVLGAILTAVLKT